MDVIDELITHCEAWEPWARVMGNVCAGDAAQALRNLCAELETEESRRHEVVRERNALRDELAVERKRVGSYRTLVFSLESQISRHRANASEAAEAIRTLDSEREANATLTAELAECNARPDCRTCDHCSPDYVCRLMCRTPIVCINGDAYTPTESVRLYEAKARKGEEEGDGHAAR